MTLISFLFGCQVSWFIFILTFNYLSSCTFLCVKTIKWLFFQIWLRSILLMEQHRLFYLMLYSVKKQCQKGISRWSTSSRTLLLRVPRMLCAGIIADCLRHGETLLKPFRRMRHITVRSRSFGILKFQDFEESIVFEKTFL